MDDPTTDPRKDNFIGSISIANAYSKRMPRIAPIRSKGSTSDRYDVSFMGEQQERWSRCYRVTIAVQLIPCLINGKSNWMFTVLIAALILVIDRYFKMYVWVCLVVCRERIEGLIELSASGQSLHKTGAVFCGVGKRWRPI